MVSIRAARRFVLLMMTLVGCGSAPSGEGDGGKSGGDTAEFGTSSSTGNVSDSTATDDAASTDSGSADTSGSATTDDTSSDGGESSTGGVVEPVLYVHARAGLDSNPGTPDAPVRTIQRALELAAVRAVQTVHVAAGEYTASTSDDDPIDLPGGISLVGGFAADDWREHVPLDHVTRITGQGDYVVRIQGGNREDTLLEGFEVVGDGITGPVVLVDGSPTVRRNVVSKSISIANANGIDVVGGAPRISRNRIFVRDGNDITAAGAVGVHLGGDGGLVDANMISAVGEGSFAQTAGIAIVVSTEAPVQIYANTLHAGGYYSYAVSGYLAGTEIIGNAFAAYPTPNFTGCVSGGQTYPVALTHNNFDCPAFYTVPDNQPISTLQALNDLPGAAENVSVSVAFVDPGDGDLHIGGGDALLCAFAVGGADLGEMVDLDHDGLLRTEPWTIGAQEVDSPCL